MVLSYFEGAVEDIPDEKIWHHPARLEEWFAAAEKRRESGMSPVDAGDDTDMTTNQIE